MRIFSVGTLKTYWEAKGNEASEVPLRAWIKVVKTASWKTPIDVKAMFPASDQLTGGRMIFDIKGNDYRIVAGIDYRKFTVFIKFVGDHKQYDEFNKKK